MAFCSVCCIGIVTVFYAIAISDIARAVQYYHYSYHSPGHILGLFC
ncbi:uncharacterized protein An14g04440 [Aspergillus niger]|uniref:Contig An14c0150, genomic contig n=2 Tax=Aspergillus niger TaxID=5061 RepID=A2R3I8_ASPNC|nr:uncharacterized protein An14g04440 [Aspergillus niger]CAK42006.1 unnamed protein product [Aspergillus niger]